MFVGESKQEKTPYVLTSHGAVKLDSLSSRVTNDNRSLGHGWKGDMKEGKRF